MAKKITCECEGLNLVKQMVDLEIKSAWGEEDAYIKASMSTGRQIYDHLVTQANRPENKNLRPAAMERLEKSRGRIGEYAEAEQGLMVLDEMKDALHMTPELRILMLCNKSQEGADVLKDICSLLRDAIEDPTKETNQIISKLSAKLGCDSLLSEKSGTDLLSKFKQEFQ